MASQKVKHRINGNPAISPVGIDVPQRTKSRGVSLPSQALLHLLDHSSPLLSVFSKDPAFVSHVSFLFQDTEPKHLLDSDGVWTRRFRQSLILRPRPPVNLLSTRCHLTAGLLFSGTVHVGSRPTHYLSASHPEITWGPQGPQRCYQWHKLEGLSVAVSWKPKP